MQVLKNRYSEEFAAILYDEREKLGLSRVPKKARPEPTPEKQRAIKQLAADGWSTEAIANVFKLQPGTVVRYF